MNYFNFKLSSKGTLNQLFLKPFGRCFFSLLVQNISFWKVTMVSVWLWFISKMPFLEHHHNRLLSFQSWFLCVLVILITTRPIEWVETIWLLLLFRLLNLASGADNLFLPLSPPQDSPSAVTFHHSYCCFNNPIQCCSGNFALHCSKTTLNQSSM